MNHRQRVKAILHYESYDRMPVVHFGFWGETLLKWAEEGHITKEEAKSWWDGGPADATITDKLGFDFNWSTCFGANTFLSPCFERKVLEEMPDGSQKVVNSDGVVVLEKPGVVSIPAEIDHLLKDRAAWEEHYLHRLQWHEERLTDGKVLANLAMLPWDEGGLAFLKQNDRDYNYGLFCGSVLGSIRNVLGVTGLTYLYADDETLLDEIIHTVSDLIYRGVETILESGAQFDFAHFWEDICFKSGPLVHPYMFAEKAGPHYKRVTDLLLQHGVDIVSVDCDGCIDALIPIWMENGVNTMFPIEVGTWNASIAPWRETYGRELRGVGGMNKTVFARDRAAIDDEVERLKPLVDLGGFIPCPDHRIAPDAKWDNVGYYADAMRKAFG
jgi:uroporphyrinogen decarboxylase